MSLSLSMSLIATFLESSPSGELHEEEGPGRRNHRLSVRRLQNDWREWFPYPSVESAFLGQQSLALLWRATGWCKPECCAAIRRMSKAVAGPGHMEVAGGVRLD